MAERQPLHISHSEEWIQRQRVTSTCAICGASIEALVPEAAAWFAQHRKVEHPDLPEPQPRRGSGKRLVSTRPQG